MPFTVQKVDGTKEEYDENKIRNSALRVGVPKAVQEEMLEHIRGRLYDGITTSEIFTMIKEFLHTGSHHTLADKYNLKEALSALGPSGYPFEKFVALLLTKVGYSCRTNQIMQGQCVTHEVDVVAEKDNHTYVIEAKFHKSAAQRTDVRVPLYIRARYEDIAAALPKVALAPWIVTNTRFSTDAIKYSRCKAIRLTSWGYPEGEGIMDLIEHTRLFPVTMIELLSQEDKLRLLNSGVVACEQLLDPVHEDLLPRDIREQVLSEVNELCRN
jgi:hypothetical protein